MSAQSKDGLLAVLGSMIGLTTIAVGLRLFARKHQHLPFQADDLFANISWIAFIGAAACEFALIHNKSLGYSKHVKSTAPADVTSKIEISWDIIGTVSLACSKLSAVFFYRRIFCVGGRKGWFEYTTQVTIAAIVCWLITFCFLAAFQCGSHFSALWDGTYNTYCVYSFPYLLGVSISGFLLDIWILILPIPRVLQLRASLSQKLSIIGVFLLALVGLGASTARMVTYVEVSTGGAAYYETHDPEAATTMASYTAMLEMGISLVAVNLPSLWLLFTQVVPEKVTQGLRSVASLTSIASRRSNSNSNSSPGSDADSDHTGSRKCSTTRSGSFAGEKANNDSVYVYNDDIEAARWGLHHTR